MQIAFSLQNATFDLRKKRSRPAQPGGFRSFGIYTNKCLSSAAGGCKRYREPRREDGSLRVTLPIQNLIEKDTQYLLSLHLDTGEQTINYYTRIIWTDNDNANQMVSFARNFAEKTFDYNAARDLTTYLETSDTEDNTDLGNVTIHSSFSQLTWGDTDMQLATDIEVCLKEFDGIMGAVELKYMTTRTNELDSTERYQVVEEYTIGAAE